MFQFYKQLDTMDCGPACLRMIAKHYGRVYSLADLRERCHITREGVSLMGISDAAESIGLRATGVKITWEQLRDDMPLPCIVHWNQRHFIVVYDIKKKHGQYLIKVADPASDLLVYTQEAFLKSWLSAPGNPGDAQNGTAPTYGFALMLEPTPAFYKDEGDDKKKFGFKHLFSYLKPYKSFIVQILLAMLVTTVISLILPFITQSIVDVGIGTGDISFVVMLLIAQLALTLGQMANNLIRSWLMLHTTTRISISLISDFLCKLMKLPIAFFDSKKIGDIMQRIGDYNRIQTFLTGSLLSIVIAVVTSIVYGGIMAGYNWGIFLVFFIGAALYIGWVLLFLKKRRKLDYMRFQEASANQSNLVQLINGMQEIKLNNCEKQKRWDWERIQARLFKVSVKSLTLGQSQEVGGTFIDQTKNILISFLAAKAVIDGNMTIGMMMSLQYIMGQLNAPISQFISFVQASQDASISLERLGEIHDMKDEEPEGEQRITEIPENADIVFDNVTFQYDGPHSAKVLNEVSLRIPANKVTAIVGASGSGKTTMLKMILGFYKPVSGEVRLGGASISNYSERAWRSQCGSVMQEGYIFSDSIAGNIGVSDEKPDMARVRQAADVSNIRQWIEMLPLGYNTAIGADGHGLSSGQKQRILIARAAYKNAKFLFFDEATNSLDANNEKAIMENLDKLFKNKTVIVVAHRLSTVRNADNIIVLDRGRIAEEGTHDQLTAKRGKYYELVKNQLELGN